MWYGICCEKGKDRVDSKEDLLQPWSVQNNAILGLQPARILQALPLPPGIVFFYLFSLLPLQGNILDMFFPTTPIMKSYCHRCTMHLFLYCVYFLCFKNGKRKIILPL